MLLFSDNMDILKCIGPVRTQSTHVHINDDNIRVFVHSFDKNKISSWLHISPFDLTQLSQAEKIGFVFALNSMSFSYWGIPKWTITYHEKEYDGAQAMMACLGRAREQGIRFTPNYFATIRREDLEEILRGKGEIPLLDERLKDLQEVGKVTLQKYKGDFRYLIDQAQGDAVQLVDLLVNNFPSLRDSSNYRGQRVWFSKRAQLLTSDINYVVENLKQSDKLTACADYKLPQVLRRYGILQYSDELQQKIRAGIQLPAGCEEEVEIRAHTIWAVELIKEQLKQTPPHLTSMQINDYLWLEGQVKLPTDELYHLTRTTAY